MSLSMLISTPCRHLDVAGAREWYREDLVGKVLLNFTQSLDSAEC